MFVQISWQFLQYLMSYFRLDQSNGPTDIRATPLAQLKVACVKVFSNFLFAFEEKCVSFASRAVSACVIKGKLPVIKTRDQRAFLESMC